MEKDNAAQGNISQNEGMGVEKPVVPEKKELLLGKFESVGALERAYSELEAEFTRRSQKLKAYEEVPQKTDTEAQMRASGALNRAETDDEGMRTRETAVPAASVPLMAGGGAHLAAPARRPKTIAEAGALALTYLRRNTN